MMVGHGLGPPFDFTSLTLRFAQGTRRERCPELVEGGGANPWTNPIKNLESQISNPESQIPNLKSRIPNLESQILYPFANLIASSDHGAAFRMAGMISSGVDTTVHIWAWTSPMKPSRMERSSISTKGS